MLIFLAHAGETHLTTVETSVHFLQDWFIALPLLALTIASVGAFVYFISRRSKSVTYLTTIGALFVIGVGSYTMAPIISVAALVLGMIGVLLPVMVSLGSRQNSNK